MGKLDELINKSDDILKLLDVEIVDNDYFKDDDPDSSEVAWEHYKIMYEGTIKIDTSVKWGYGKNRQIGYFDYKNKVPKDPMVQVDWGNLVIGKISLAGDCVFNFNEKKFKIFKKFAIGDIELLGKLLYCYKMHHSPYNFALMPVSGGMNNKKGSHNDRPDWLLYSLSEIYKYREDREKSEDIKRLEDYINKPTVKQAADIPKDKREDIKKQIFDMQKSGYEIMWQRYNTPINLYHFLAQIGSVEAYAELFYHLTDDDQYDENDKDSQTLLETMIASGKDFIDGPKKLEVYMDLAIRYWKVQQEKYRENIKKSEIK